MYDVIYFSILGTLIFVFALLCLVDFYSNKKINSKFKFIIEELQLEKLDEKDYSSVVDFVYFVVKDRHYKRIGK